MQIYHIGDRIFVTNRKDYRTRPADFRDPNLLACGREDVDANGTERLAQPRRRDFHYVDSLRRKCRQFTTVELHTVPKLRGLAPNADVVAAGHT